MPSIRPTCVNRETNIRYGAHYLRQMLERLQDNPALATAAYNAGPNKVMQWLPADHPVPADVWAETIPYRKPEPMYSGSWNTPRSIGTCWAWKEIQNHSWRQDETGATAGTRPTSWLDMPRRHPKKSNGGWEISRSRVGHSFIQANHPTLTVSARESLPPTGHDS